MKITRKPSQQWPSSQLLLYFSSFIVIISIFIKIDYFNYILHVLALSATDKKVDEILHKIFPAGDDHHPMLEDPAKVKEFCEKLSIIFCTWYDYIYKLYRKPYNEFNEYLGHLKGLTHKLAEILLNVLQPPFLCGAIKGDYKKWTQLGVTMNKHKEDIKKARYGLLAALHNAGKDGKCTIPELGW